MKFLQRLGFTTADEADLQIAFVAVRSSWLVTMLALLLWSTYDLIVKQTMTMPLNVLLLGGMVYFATELYLQRQRKGKAH